ncbi:MAG: SCP2 sterol-binding domain-containing protein, partial [Acidimicrobiales bacterium]
FIRRGAADAPALDGSVHLHCTDTDGEWTVRPAGDDGLSVSRDHAKADAALRGPAHDLLMALWRRCSLDGIDVFGDAALAGAFVGRPDLS